MHTHRDKNIVSNLFLIYQPKVKKECTVHKHDNCTCMDKNNSVSEKSTKLTKNLSIKERKKLPVVAVGVCVCEYALANFRGGLVCKHPINLGPQLQLQQEIYIYGKSAV